MASAMIIVYGADMTVILDQWEFTATQCSANVILPDGCCDVIQVRPDTGPPRVFLSNLQHSPEPSIISAGDVMTGFRLHPGTWVSVEWLTTLTGDEDTDQLQQQINENCATVPALNEILRHMAQNPVAVSQVARDLGVSRKTLLRQFRRHHLPPPEFWLRLARVKLAAAQLKNAELAEIAYGSGFSDQAHMTREFRKWFHCTPGHMRKQPDLMAQAIHPAFGVTGEQISTR